MIISLNPLGAGSVLVAPVSTFVAELALDNAALKATFAPQTLTAAPSSPIVAPGLYRIATAGLTIALGTPTQWRCGMVQIKDYTGQPAPNITVTGAIDGQTGALINSPGESLSFSWDPIDQTWVML